MALQYNPPPGWPVPAGGWKPPLDWHPDPSWPPAPDGWPFWLEPDSASGPQADWKALLSPRFLAAVVVVGLIGVGAASSLHDSSKPQRASVAFTASSLPPTEPTALPQPTVSPTPAETAAKVVKPAGPTATRRPSKSQAKTPLRRATKIKASSSKAPVTPKPTTAKPGPPWPPGLGGLPGPAPVGPPGSGSQAGFRQHADHSHAPPWARHGWPRQ
jgi:hypothetical protein